jgi:hypothetical protein
MWRLFLIELFDVSLIIVKFPWIKGLLIQILVCVGAGRVVFDFLFVCLLVNVCRVYCIRQ